MPVSADRSVSFKARENADKLTVLLAHSILDSLYDRGSINIELSVAPNVYFNEGLLANKLLQKRFKVLVKYSVSLEVTMSKKDDSVRFVNPHSNHRLSKHLRPIFITNRT